jgi:hypothetical protein
MGKVMVAAPPTHTHKLAISAYASRELNLVAHRQRREHGSNGTSRGNKPTVGRGSYQM